MSVVGGGVDSGDLHLMSATAVLLPAADVTCFGPFSKSEGESNNMLATCSIPAQDLKGIQPFKL